MQRAFKASEMRVVRPKNLTGEPLRRVLEMRVMKDDNARSKLFRSILAEHGEAYLGIEDTLTQNIGRFVFLASILSPKNRAVIVPLLREYTQLPGFYVTEEEDGRIRARCRYDEAMKVPAEQYHAVEHAL